MTRYTLAIALLFSSGSLVHAHELEAHVNGYGLGPFGLNVGLELSDRATFTIGVDGFYASSQAEGFSSTRIGAAVIPIGFKIYLTDVVVDRVAPHIRVMGVVGAGGDTYEGERRILGIFGGFAGVGATYFVRDALGLGTEAGVGYVAYHRPDFESDRVATFTWRMTLVFRFGESLANPEAVPDHAT